MAIDEAETPSPNTPSVQFTGYGATPEVGEGKKCKIVRVSESQAPKVDHRIDIIEPLLLVSAPPDTTPPRSARCRAREAARPSRVRYASSAANTRDWSAAFRGRTASRIPR